MTESVHRYPRLVRAVALLAGALVLSAAAYVWVWYLPRPKAFIEDQSKKRPRSSNAELMIRENLVAKRAQTGPSWDEERDRTQPLLVDPWVQKEMGVSWTSSPRTIEFSDSGKIAWERGEYAIKVAPRGTEILVENGRYTTIWSKDPEANEWVARVDFTHPDEPSRLKNLIGAPWPSRRTLGTKELRKLEVQLQELPSGYVAFGISPEMELEKTYPVILLLSPSVEAEVLKQEHQERADPRIITRAEQSRIAPITEAKLMGSNFAVLSILPEIQAVTLETATEWQWDVTPTKEGTQYLHLTLTAILERELHARARALRTFDTKVQVTITPTERLLRSMDKHTTLWTVVLVPFAGMVAGATLWLVRKLRPKPKIGFTP